MLLFIPFGPVGNSKEYKDEQQLGKGSVVELNATKTKQGSDLKLCTRFTDGGE